MLLPQRWQRLHTLRDVCQLNEYLLEVLSRLSQAQKLETAGFLAEHADLLSRLDPKSRCRAASIPVLLLDLKFQDEQWWRAVLESAARPRVRESWPAPYTECWRAELTRQALLVAWPAVREDRRAARLLFGMSESVAALMSSLSPQQLDFVGVHRSHEMQPRWGESPRFWRRLLSCALSEDPGAMSEVHLYGLQLLGGELMREREPSPLSVARHRTHTLPARKVS